MTTHSSTSLTSLISTKEKKVTSQISTIMTTSIQSTPSSRSVTSVDYSSSFTTSDKKTGI